MKMIKILFCVMLFLFSISTSASAINDTCEAFLAGDVCYDHSHDGTICTINAVNIAALDESCPRCVAAGRNGSLYYICSGIEAVAENEVDCKVLTHPNNCIIVQKLYYTDITCDSCPYYQSTMATHIESYRHTEVPTVFDDHYCNY